MPCPTMMFFPIHHHVIDIESLIGLFMKNALFLIGLFLAGLASPLVLSASADNHEAEGMGILHTAVNPTNNNTYHLLTASSWEDAASYARSLDGFLVTVDDEDENTWLFDTFASWDDQSRHLWTGLSDHADEGQYRWHDGTPFLFRAWGEEQPSEGGDENYVHIASTNMGNINPGTWNDLENDPQYFPVYGVVELGPGADYALRFDGQSDHIAFEHDDALDMTNMTHLELSAWVHPYSLEGNQFLMMKGDYGWGMYLSEGHVAFASEYSLSRHPISNATIEADAWSFIQVLAVVGEGYTFSINGEEAGVVLEEEASVPLGDFGSNDCYENEWSCDELYIARMGAGCDCNHFEGVLDNMTVRSGMSESTLELRLHLDFPEGEGSETLDATGERTGFIEGADWVMPDGSIVAQAVELFIGEGFDVEFAAEGDTLLFFVEIEEYTRFLNWYSYSLKFDDFEEMTEYTLYAQSNVIPDEWNHDTESFGEFGFVYESWSWPTEGIMWFTMVLHTDVEDLFIELEADIADPPPTLDDMTELKESIPVTNQELNGNSFTNEDFNANYYYVNVTEPLADLRIKTYSGRGNVEIGISYYSPPSPQGFWWGGFDEGEEVDDGKEPTVELEAWSTGPGNEEEVHLFDVEPGMYYITAYSFRNAQGFTIVADFVYPPENVEPDDAITLTPGIEYGLLSGYEGLNQYFKVEVPQGTERLVVDLNDGAGEASLFMRRDQAPSSSTYDHHSTTQGANDRIAFNDPTPGWWYILLTSESAFTGVNIVAEFADRYVWDYDGTPIELFNDEALDGIAVGKGGEIAFYAVLDEPGDMFWLETYGGSGDIMLTVEGMQYEIEFTDGGGRPGTGFGVETVPVDAELVSGKDGTNHQVSLEFPLNGRFDITMTGLSDAEEISILVRWDRSDFPVEPFEPIEPVDPEMVQTCEERAVEAFAEADLNGDGVVDIRELDQADIGQDDIETTDLNDDGMVEYREALQAFCTCETELNDAFAAYSAGRGSVPITVMDNHEWANVYDFKSVTLDKDDLLDEEELDLLLVLCDTTFDAFDGDGDGVPDEQDAFPDDPTETKDTDGDGVGDNSDIVASVSNDLIYASAGVVFIILAGLLIGFLRSGRTPTNDPMWDGQDAMSEAAFSDTGSDAYQKEAVALPEAPMLSPSSFESASFEHASLGVEESLLVAASLQPPSPELMGMMLDGVETIEYPTGSDQIWTRSSPEGDWQAKL